MKKLIATVALVASLAGVSVLATASPASAGAYGCSGWGARQAGNYWVASGAYCATISGQGRYVQAVSGSYGATRVCNWNITAEFFDSSGRWYQTFTGGTHWSCGSWQNDVIWLDRYVQRGTMCSTLKSNGVRLTSVCHSIY